jgi:transposase-like protein
MEDYMREKYSENFKKEVVKKLLPPINKTTTELSQEIGVSPQSIRNWKKNYLTNNKNSDIVNSSKLNLFNKYKIVLEAESLPEDEYGKWLRSNGFYSDQIKLWKGEIERFMRNDIKKLKADNSKLKDENKRLKKDLEKKDKALSEASALLILKKKADLIWGVKEED